MKRFTSQLYRIRKYIGFPILLTVIGVLYLVFHQTSDRAVYEQKINNHAFSQRHFESLNDLETIPKKDRPDLAWEQNFLMTMDPALGYPTKERLLPIYKHVQEFKKLKAGIPGDVTNNWVERGPDNIAGRVRALMFDPNDATNKKVWAGSVSGGLWYNNDITDANSSWVAVDDFWANLAIGTIAYDPANTQVFYAGTGEGWYNADAVQGAGIWKSTNGGQAWTQLSSTNNSNFKTTQKIVVNSAGRVLVASSAGIFISDDGGTSWTNKSAGFAADLEIASNGDIYAGKGRSGTNGSILKSTDGGDTFVDVTPLGSTQERVELAVAPSNSNVIYAVASDANDVSWLKKSVNGGTSWTDITIPKYLEQNCAQSTADDFTRGQAWYDLILAVHPTNENLLLAGGIDINKSENAGASWSTVSYWTGSCHPYVHADQHAIVFRPGSPNEAVFGSDGGISYSGNIGSSASPGFSNRNKGFNITQYYAGAIHPDALKNFYLGGSQDNGSHKFESTGINSVSEVTGGDGAFCFIDQSQPNIQITSYVYNNYYISKDAGKSFNTLQEANDGSFINPSAYDNNLHILYSTKGVNSINRIKNININPEIDYITVTLGSKASHIKVSPYTTGSSTIFVGTQAGKIFKLTNANTDNPSITEITDVSFPAGTISCIELGASEDEILVTFSNYGVNSVWYTGNGGTSWASKEGDLPDMPVRWALFNPNDRTQAVLATEVGVWSTSAFGNASPTWSPSNSGLANVRVDMLKIRQSDYEVLAVTHGRGMFTSDAFSTIDKNALAAYFSTKNSRNIGIGGSVEFEDLSTGTPTSWSWVFEGGNPSTSNEQNPAVTYTNPGDFKVTLIVSDGSGSDTTIKTAFVRVGQVGGWTVQATGFSSPSRGIDYIDMVDNNIVWATAYDGSSSNLKIKEFTKTIDGGSNWTPYTINITGDIYPAMICAINADTAWIPMYPNSTGAGGGIYITVDGGTTWTKQASASFTGNDAFANVVHFWNKNEGFCMGDPNGGYFEIYTTKDGGANWARVAQADIPTPLGLDEYGTVGQFCVADDGVVFFNTTKGRIFKSTNKGASWSLITTPLSGRMKIAFADENNGVMVESATNVTAAKVYRTANGGTSWESVTNTDVFSSFIKYVPGTQRMYVTSSANTSKAGASFSIDGGKTWERYSEQDGKQCLAIDFYDMTLGWFGQFNTSATAGGILKYTGPATIPGFTISPENVVLEEAVVFTDITLSIESGKVHSWSFGENATPASASTEGPHSVTYSQKGYKTVNLIVNGISTQKEFHITYTGIEDVTNQFDFNAYPNPSNGNFTISTNNKSNAELLLQVYSLNGQIIYFNKIKPGIKNMPLNLEKFGKGMYLLRVRGQDIFETRKIIIE